MIVTANTLLTCVITLYEGCSFLCVSPQSRSSICIGTQIRIQIQDVAKAVVAKRK